MIKTSFKLENSQSTQLPPLANQKVSSAKEGITQRRAPMKNDTDHVITEYQLKFEQLKK